MWMYDSISLYGNKRLCSTKRTYLTTGNYQQALETYKTIHKRFPENVECKYTN